MIKKALRIGQLITNAHPSDVRLLFQAYNIKAEPTGKTILDAYLVYGKPFLDQLLEIGFKSVNPLSSTTGTLPLETEKLLANSAALTAKAQADAKKEKADTANVINGWFSTAMNGLMVGTNYYTAISNMLKGKPVDVGNSDPNSAINLEYLNAKAEADAAASANSTKTYLLIGAGLLVAILVGIMFIKRK